MADIPQSVRDFKPPAPSTDYGQLYYHAASNAVHYVSGDADGNGAEVHAMLSKLDGIGDVGVSDEGNPSGDGWQLVSRNGEPVTKADDISNAPWNGSPAHFSDDQWKASCVLDRGGTVTSAKARYALPVREPDGTLNRKGMAAAQGALNGSRGGVKAPPAAITAAKAKLKRLYGDAGISKADVDLDVPIWKANDGHGDEPMVVYGVVLQPGIRDSQGDIVSAAEIEKACHAYMLDSRMIDLQHNDVQEPGAGVVESYIAPSDMVVAGKPVMKGSWVMATAITDPVRKADIREGRLTGYSIGGSAVRI